MTDVEAAMLPDSPPARISTLVREEDKETGAAKVIHAAIGGTGAALEAEDLKPNVVSRSVTS